MNARTIILLALWLTLTTLFVWTATWPDPYFEGLPADLEGRSYPWEYPVGFAVVGALSLVALRPWRGRHSFSGAAVSFCLFATAAVLLGMTALHSVPAHGYLLLASVLLSQAALFYCGYAFAVRTRGVDVRGDTTRHPT